MGPSETSSVAQEPGSTTRAAAPSSSSSSSSISFTVALDGEKPRRFRIAPGKRAVKVGRGPKNDIVLMNNGVSGHHLDILAVSGSNGPVLAVRDTSMNGTGLQSGPGQTPLRLAKDAQVELLGCSVLLLPFKVKVAEGQLPASDTSLRAVLRVSVNDEAKRAKHSGKSGEGASKKRRLAKVKSSGSKQAKSAVVEDMLARCQAFAQTMESKRRREEKSGVAPQAASLPPPGGPPPPAPAAPPPAPLMPEGATAKAPPSARPPAPQPVFPPMAGAGANAMPQNLQQMHFASALQQGFLSQQLAASQAMAAHGLHQPGGLPGYGMAAAFGAAMPAAAAQRLGAPQMMMQGAPQAQFGFQGRQSAAAWGHQS